MNVSVILPAAGFGTRMGGANRKQFLHLDGVPVLVRTIRKFAAAPAIGEIIVAVRPEDQAAVEEMLAKENAGKPVRVVQGGISRQESVENALRTISPDVELVAVHDAVRPFVDLETIQKVIDEAARTGAAIVGIVPVDTVKQVHLHKIRATIPRERLILTQTPQVFRRDLLIEAFARARADQFTGTDESSLVERLDQVEVSVIPGSDRNIKITRPHDLKLAELFLSEEILMRIGQGWDNHRLTAGRPLILGGVTIPSDYGLDGHSDADILLHAITDALLGSVALGDIGMHFPDTDPQWRGAASARFVQHAQSLVTQRGYSIVNLDCTVILERPKLKDFRTAIRDNVAHLLNLPIEDVNVKFKTSEKVGPVGEGLSAEAQAVVLIARTC